LSIEALLQWWFHLTTYIFSHHPRLCIMARREIWQKPVLHNEEAQALERRVGWLELFYDLFLVVTISQLSQALQTHVSWEGLRSYVLLFAAVFWMWNGWVFYNERFETTGLENRLFFFLQMLGMTGLAVFANNGSAAEFSGFVLCYVAGRFVTTFLWLRASYHSPAFRPTGLIFALSFTTGNALELASLLDSAHNSDLRCTLFATGLAVEIISPLFTIKTQRALPPMSSSKRPERFGLFIIIILGEAVIAVTQGIARSAHDSLAMIIPATLGVAVSFGLWWIYFDFIARRPPRPSVAFGALWMYGHLALAMSIGAVGTGLLLTITSTTAVLDFSTRALLCGAVGAALIAMGLIEFTLKRDTHEPSQAIISESLKLASGAACVALIWAHEPLQNALQNVLQNILQNTLQLPNLLHTLMLSAVTLLMLLLAILAVNMIYGLWVWFRQDLPEAVLTERNELESI
jgi:low temperature requirement protein LtrA